MNSLEIINIANTDTLNLVKQRLLLEILLRIATTI